MGLSQVGILIIDMVSQNKLNTKFVIDFEKSVLGS